MDYELETPEELFKAEGANGMLPASPVVYDPQKVVQPGFSKLERAALDIFCAMLQSKDILGIPTKAAVPHWATDYREHVLENMQHTAWEQARVFVSGMGLAEVRVMRAEPVKPPTGPSPYDASAKRVKKGFRK